MDDDPVHTPAGDVAFTPRFEECIDDIAEGLRWQVLPSTPRAVSQARTPLSDLDLDVCRLLKQQEELMLQQTQAMFARLGVMMERVLVTQAEMQPVIRMSEQGQNSDEACAEPAQTDGTGSLEIDGFQGSFAPVPSSRTSSKRSVLAHDGESIHIENTHDSTHTYQSQIHQGRKHDIMAVVGGAASAMWDPVIEPVRQRAARQSGWYELLIAVLILAHAAYLGIQVQHDAALPSESSSVFESSFETCSLFFCGMFSLDLLIILCREQKHFFVSTHRCWNIIILFIVLCMVADEVAIRWDSKVPIFRSARFFQTLRIIRSIGLLPFSPMLRNFRIIIFSMLNSCAPFLWIVVICNVLVYSLALFFTQGTIDVCDSGHSPAVCEKFGSIYSSMLTLLEALFSGQLWGNALECLQDVDVIYPTVFLTFVMFARCIIVNIVLGLVTGIQMEAARHERQIVIQDSIRNRERYIETMTHIFKEIDINESGSISKEELELALENQRMDAFLAALQLDIHDVQMILDTFDVDGSGALDIEEFIEGCLRCRGEAMALDVVKLQRDCAQIMRGVLQVQDELQKPSDGRRCLQSTYVSSAADNLQAEEESLTDQRTSTTQNLLVRDISSSMDQDHGKNRSQKLIEKVEERAMTLKELQRIRLSIIRRCSQQQWDDAATGEILTKERVTLYHFNYHCICPKTLPQGVFLHGIQSSSIKLEQKQSVEQIDPNGRIRVIAKGIIIGTPESGRIQVQVTKGRFVEEADCHIFVQGVDVGVPSSIKMPMALSYKELYSSTPRKPTWFCSHWWGEAVLDFVACCEKHAALRKLRGDEAAYWVCAYANRQHEIGLEINVPLERCSFVKALKQARGTLLVLDPMATAIHRIWCDLELYRTLCDGSKQLDIVTVPEEAAGTERVPHVLTQGLLPSEGTAGKKKREQNFPIALLAEGMHTKLEEGEATVPADKNRILKEIGTQLQRANAALNAYFAQAAWAQAVRSNTVCDFDRSRPGTLSLPDILVKDELRKVFHLNLGHLSEVTDAELQSLARGLPPNLTQLQLCFECCVNISDNGVCELTRGLSHSLRDIHLDFLGCSGITDLGVEAIGRNLPTSVEHLRLDFAKCTHISEMGARSLGKYLAPLKLQTCILTFKGTNMNRNFNRKAELLTTIAR